MIATRLGSLAALALGTVLVIASCGPPSSAPLPETASPATSATGPAAIGAPSASPAAPSPGPATPRHVFVVVMENRTLAQALNGGYLADLADRSVLATNYHSVATPSLPNYLALTSGETFGIRDDRYHALPAVGIGQQLTSAGVPWRAYIEGLTEGCLDSPYPYAVQHNPFAYYGGECPKNVVSLDQLAADLRGTTPRFVWITPDLCHDGHDCATADADAWLAATVPMILASQAWRDDGVLFIVWDEGSGGDDRIPLVVIAPKVAARRVTDPLDHYSLLATVEDVLGVPRLGGAVGARSLDELLR